MEKPEMMQENLTRPWHERIDPVTKLLLISVLTLLSFVLTNIFAEAALILATIFLLLFSGKLGSSMKALGFCAFMILTMLLIQGLFYPHNETLAFSLGTIAFYQEGLTYAALLGCRIIVIVLATNFFMQTTTISENAKYLENAGMKYKTVYLLMSVCYILPQMMQNLKKIQLAQRARGIGEQKSLIQKFKTILPILIPLVIKTLDQSMSRSISLQLRNFESKKRTVRALRRTYLMDKLFHRALGLTSIILIGCKVWMIINK